MTWIDDDGVAHLVHQLPEEVWKKMEEASRSVMTHAYLIADEGVPKDSIVIIGNNSASVPRVEYPRYVTYCGVPRRGCADNPSGPTCLTCVHVEGLTQELERRGIPWWR